MSVVTQEAKQAKWTSDSHPFAHQLAFSLLISISAGANGYLGGSHFSLQMSGGNGNENPMSALFLTKLSKADRDC